MRMIKFNRSVFMSMLSCVIAVTAHAQSTGLEEIIVTAQKREENIQRTPISMAAFGADAIERMQINSVADIDKVVPNVVLSPFPASRTAITAFIRSIGNVDLQITKDAGVGIYIDGVFLGRASGLSSDITDLERIEVLRGPQGTLYGRNTTGGAINMITAKPHDALEFQQKVTVGNYDLWRSQTTLNLPLGESLAVRASYLRTDRRGLVRNRGAGDDFSKDHKEAVRVALRWHITDSLMLDYAWDRSTHDGGMTAYQMTDAMTPAFLRYSSSSRKSTLSSGTGDRGGIDDKVKGHALTLTWDIDDASELKSISAYRELTNHNYYDYSLSVNYGNRFGNITGPLPSLMTRGAEVFDTDEGHDQWQLSQEVQLVSRLLDDRLEYVIGAYFFKEQGWDQQSQQNNLIALNAITQDPHGPAYALMLPAIWPEFRVTAKAESKAIYGQFTYTPEVLDERLHLTLGFRFTKDKRNAHKTALAYDPGLFDPAVRGVEIDAWEQSGSVNSTNSSPSLTIAYDINDEVNVYAKYSEAYRSGGFNGRSDRAGFAQGFKPEELTAYEVGVKSLLFENRLRLNAAAFHYRYDDMQIDHNVPPNIGVTRTRNAGKAKVDGFEADVTGLLTDNLTLTIGYGYLDTKIKKFYDVQTCDGVSLLGGAVVDVSSCRYMPAAPRNTYDVTFDYVFSGIAVGELSARIQYHHEDKMNFSVRGGWLSRDAFELVNASLQWAKIPVGNGEFSAMLWGRNLDNEEYFAHAMSFGAFQLATFGEPRTYGLDLIYKF